MSWDRRQAGPRGPGGPLPLARRRLHRRAGHRHHHPAHRPRWQRTQPTPQGRAGLGPPDPPTLLASGPGLQRQAPRPPEPHPGRPGRTSPGRRQRQQARQDHPVRHHPCRQPGPGRGQHRPGPDPWPGRWCYPPTGSCGFQPLNPHDRVRNVRTHHHASASQSGANYNAKGVFLIVLVRTGPMGCFYLWSREDCRSGRGHWREGEVLSGGRRDVLYILMRLRRGGAVPGYDNATRCISGRASSGEKDCPYPVEVGWRQK